MSQTLLIMVAAVLVFVVIAGLGFAFAGADPQRDRAIKRAQSLGTGAREGRRSRTASAVNSTDARRKQILKGLKDQERRQKKARMTLANKLRQAGLSITIPQFWMVGGGFGLSVFVVLIILRIHPLIALGLGAAMSLGFPLWVVGFLAKRRTAKFTSLFSDAMDVIVRGIKSGLPVHDCLKIIARETPEPLCGEFSRLVENVGMGMTFDQALDRLCEHMPTSEVRFFSIVMNIQQKTGGNLAEALGNLSTVLRSRKLMREKIKALSSEATTSAGIIGSLPPSVVVLISVTTPAYMAPMFSDHRGWFMLGIGGVLMSIGVFVMVRMINFKF